MYHSLSPIVLRASKKALGVGRRGAEASEEGRGGEADRWSPQKTFLDVRALEGHSAHSDQSKKREFEIGDLARSCVIDLDVSHIHKPIAKNLWYQG